MKNEIAKISLILTSILLVLDIAFGAIDASNPRLTYDLFGFTAAFWLPMFFLVSAVFLAILIVYFVSIIKSFTRLKTFFGFIAVLATVIYLGFLVILLS